MPLQVGQVGKAPVARFANKPFLSVLVMSRFVALKNFVRSEFLLAQIALEVLVVVTNVGLAEILVHEPLFAQLAGEEFHLLIRVVPFDVVNELHVSPEGGHTKPADVVAHSWFQDSADLQMDRRLAVIANLVSSEQRGRRKSTITSMARVRSFSRMKPHVIMIHWRLPKAFSA